MKNIKTKSLLIIIFVIVISLYSCSSKKDSFSRIEPKNKSERWADCEQRCYDIRNICFDKYDGNAAKCDPLYDSCVDACD